MDVVYLLLSGLFAAEAVQSGTLLLNPVCTNVITVDRRVREGCEILSYQQATCSGLKDALSLLRQSAVAMESELQNCTDITLNDSEYVTEISNEIIEKSIYLHGRQRGTARVSIFLTSMKSESMASLNFKNSTLASISGINFVSAGAFPISFEHVNDIMIRDSSFTSFPQGAVDIYNSPNVLVSDCMFTNNGPVTEFKFDLWRGHAGGLSVAYFSKTQDFEGINVTITGCVFTNNAAFPEQEEVRRTTNLFTNFIFTGRGGGCAININTPSSSLVTVANCLFENNSALAYGGGLYLGFGVVANHMVTVQDSKFIENHTPGGAGGLEIGFANGGPNKIANNVLAVNLTFLHNEASFGGGTFIFIAGSRQGADESGNLVQFIDCHFTHNTATQYGGAIGMLITASSLIFGDRMNFISVEINSCEFISNDGGQGAAVTTNYMPVNFSGSSSFIKNKGVALQIIGSKVYLEGQLTFKNNAAVSEGGALYSVSLGQMQVKKNSRLMFINNTASLGASIVVRSLYIPPLYSRLAHNPLCVFLFDDNMLSQKSEEFSDLAYFSGNKALVGSGVYTDNIYSCSWTGEDNMSFDSQLAFRWNFFKYSLNNENRAHYSDKHNPKWFVQTQEVNLEVPNKKFSLYPGEHVQIRITARDELNFDTVSFVRLSEELSGNQTSMINLYPSVLALNNFSVYPELSISTKSSQYRNFDEMVTMVPTRGQPIKVSINVRDCPFGYSLVAKASRGEYNCKCNIQNKFILSCNGSSLLLTEGCWSSASTRSIHPCPYKYCQCSIEEMEEGRFIYLSKVNTSNPDSQCSCGREGILCGSCKRRKGYSALFSKCVSCSFWSGLWLAALIIVDMVVFVSFLVVSVKLPTYFIPCVFYLQILPSIAEYFPCSFEDFYQPLGNVASAISFYFIHDFCLGPRIDARIVYFFRYFPFLVLLLILPAMMGCLRWQKNYRNRKLLLYNIFSGLTWWIINFSYVHLTNTSMKILSCLNIHTNNDTYSKRWTISGDIECFKGGHLALSVLAICTLLLCVLLVCAVMVVTWSKVDWLKQYRSILSYPYRNSYKWWLAADFTKRFLLLLLINIYTGNNYPVMILLSLIITSHGVLMPYSNYFTNVLEVSLASVALVLLVARNTSYESLNILFGVRKTDYEVEQCSLKRKKSILSYILTFLYYIPLLVAIFGICFWLIKILRKFWRDTKERKVKAHEEEVGMDISFYSAMNDTSAIRNKPLPTVADFNQYL